MEGVIYKFKQYLSVFLVAVPIFAVLSVFNFFRYGHYDLFVANKAFSGDVVILLGIVLLIGPLSRLFDFADRYVRYRKEMGIVALLFALVHGITTLFLLSDYFPMSYFLGKFNWPVFWGLLSLVVLIGIFITSRGRVMAWLGTKRWWQLQYWGVRLAFLLAFFHVSTMKLNDWVAWYRSGGDLGLSHPEWPETGLLVGWFAVFVIVLRLAEFSNAKLGKIVWYLEVITLPVIYVATFWWGSQFVK